MKRLPFILVAVIMITVLVMSACTTPVVTEEPTAAPTEPPVEATAVPEPTAIPLGTAENPIIMAMAPSATSQELIAGGEAVAAKLTELTGYTIKTTVPNSYAAQVEALGSGNAHIGWLPPLAYLKAKALGYADVGLVVNRFGSDHYGVQFVANVDSGFTPYFDATANANTGDAATALAQFADKKPCWTDPLSASGYVLPAGVLGSLGIKTKAAAMVQGHPTVINALYAGGICDFGATYIDARTTKSVIEAKPDVMEKVVVIYRTDPLLPNDNVSYATVVPEDVRAKISEALIAMAADAEGQALLKGMGYDVQGLQVVDDTFYDEFRVYLEASGFDIYSYE